MFSVKQIKFLQFSLNTDKRRSHCSKGGINHTWLLPGLCSDTFSGSRAGGGVACGYRAAGGGWELCTESPPPGGGPRLPSPDPSLTPCANTRGENLSPWSLLLTGQRQSWCRDPRREGKNFLVSWELWVSLNRKGKKNKKNNLIVCILFPSYLSKAVFS